MVPWHPPCALCSLIFSSLDPETNRFLLLLFRVGPGQIEVVTEVSLRTQYSVFRGLLISCCHVFFFPLPTGLCSKSFSVQLSRYSSGPGFQPSGCPPVSPESDTEHCSLLREPQSFRQFFHNEALASFLWNLLFGISTRQFLAFLSSGIPLSIPSVRSTFGSASAFLFRLSP